MLYVYSKLYQKDFYTFMFQDQDFWGDKPKKIHYEITGFVEICWYHKFWINNNNNIHLFAEKIYRTMGMPQVYLQTSVTSNYCIKTCWRWTSSNQLQVRTVQYRRILQMRKLQKRDTISSAMEIIVFCSVTNKRYFVKGTVSNFNS